MERVPIFMGDPKYDNISNKIYESYPNACILFIDEVINPNLEAEYNNYKQELITKRGVDNVKEFQFFHGTHANLIDTIAAEGFDPKKNITSAYGKGSYFAKTAKYSFSYMKSADKTGVSYMFMADVLVGKVFTPSESYSNKDYDNTIDNPINISIVVVPVQQGAYPRYVIAFHKNAK
jgi:Poly(ADP-ribose) polymerase catalytic domain